MRFLACLNSVDFGTMIVVSGLYQQNQKNPAALEPYRDDWTGMTMLHKFGLGLWNAGRGFLCLGLCLGFVLCTVVGAQAQSPADWADLSDRISGLEAQLRALRERSGRLPQRVQGQRDIPSSSAAGLSLRIDGLEEQMRRLTGQMEDMSFQLRRANDQLKRFTEDAELRFQDLEKGKRRRPVDRRSERNTLPPVEITRTERFGPSNDRPQRRLTERTNQRRNFVHDRPRRRGPVGIEPIGPPSPNTSRVGPVIGPNENSSLRKAAPPTTLGRIPREALGPNANVASLDRGSGLDQPIADEAGALYERAYENYLQRKFPTAESSFRGFLRRYPNHELAGQAQYWLGETFYARRKYRKAAQAFLVGYRKFPKNRRAPESLLKLGMTLHKLGDKGQACATFDKLKREYPRAAPVIRKTSAAERRRAGC